MKQITVEIKNIYGNRMVYPACQESELLAKLAGAKTFTSQAMKILGDLGYTIHIKAQSLVA